MLNRQELINYRLLRGVSQNEVAKYSDISQTLVVLLEQGEKSVTEYNHREYCKGVNAAYQAKKEKLKNAPEKVEKEEKKPPLKKMVRKKSTPKNSEAEE